MKYNIANFLTQKYRYWIFISVFLFSFSYFLWGCYYGWLDDIIMVNLFKGTFSYQGTFSEAVFKGISHPIVFLYNILPDIPWYGLFLYSIVFISILLILKYIFKHIRFTNKNTLFLNISILLIFYIVFLSEFVILLNYTKVSVLATGISLLIYWEHIKKEPRSYFHPILLLFIISYLIRDQIVNIIIIIVLGLAISETIFFSKHRTSLIKYLSVISIIVVSLNIVFLVNNSEDFKLGKERWPYISNIVDGKRFQAYSSPIQSHEDSIRVHALRLYYFFDTTKIDLPFLEKTGGKSSFNISSIVHGKRYLHEEISKLAYKFETGGYHGLNLKDKLFYSCIFSLIILLAASLFAVRGTISYKILFLIITSSFLFYLSFLTLSILFKYEDRLFSPSYIILISFHLSLLMGQSSKQSSLISLLLLLFLFPVSYGRILSLNKISSWKKEDMKNKSEYIAELNSFKDKIFIHDYWSQFLIYQDPFHEVHLNRKNTHILFGDLPYFELESYRKYLKYEICDFNNFPDFYKCIAQKKNVIFIMPDFRKKLIEDYMKALYSVPVNFIEVYPESLLNTETYSFFWERIRYKYYVIQITE